MLNKNLISILLVLLFSVLSFADVPPDLGQIRVNPPLVFTPIEDFSDYRFFLVSPIDIEEVKVKKDETKTIDSENRGGAKKFAKLVAVLKNDLKDEKLSKEQEKALSYYAEKASFNVIELIKHSFQKDISIAERVNWTYPQYQIQRSGETLKAIAKNDISQKMSDEEEKTINNSSNLFMIIAGIFITISVIAIGVILFRRK